MNFDFKAFLKKIISSRVLVLFSVFAIMFFVALARVFTLQIIKGETYQENFTLKIQKTLSVDASRGNIYDCNGTLLAYNELAYALTITDNTSYSNRSKRNLALNAELAEILSVLEENGEKIVNDFGIVYKDGIYSFRNTGTSQRRFLADVFGKTSYDLLQYNDEFGFNEADATPEQVMEFLMYNQKTGYFYNGSNEESPEYSDKMDYEITVVRYAMNANRFTKYKPTTIAENLGDKSVAYLSEHSDRLSGIDVVEQNIRKYNYSEYFASIIGYTGKITSDEYAELSQTDDSYTMNDTVGRSGLESYYESYLRGVNGEKDVYVDNVGRISEVISNKDPIAGNDLYLSIDAQLQEATYRLLEQEIAGVVYSNIKSGDIPINDVYFALINNNVIDIEEFDDEDATAIEQDIYSTFLNRRQAAINEVYAQLHSDSPKANNDMNEALLDYFTSAFSMLKDEGIIDSSAIDTKDSVYVDWRDGKLSPRDYLQYCISQQWIDITVLNVTEKYSDSAEIYNDLCDLLIEDLENYKPFCKDVYKYMVKDGAVTGKQLCILLYEQRVLDYDDDLANGLRNGTITAYNFITDKINSMEITPAQLALDPCTGSCVITDANTGQIKALVSYPGYDNNKLANGVDAEYYNALNADLSNPQYNYATQEKTAPGSTFKMVSATAGLAENIIDTGTEITCTGIFTDISNTPKCWIYPSAHGSDNVTEAIRDSCNYYFYKVGYDLSSKDSGNYDDPSGIAHIQKYAALYGLNRKTGLEIEENTSEMADEFPVMAAIGQSNNNYTTVALARYVTAVATGRVYEYQLMSKIVSPSGEILAQYVQDYEDISGVLSENEWTAIHYGMKLVCDNLECFGDSSVQVAGKTGTAQQVATRPNHALFVGYAPYGNPQITVATRIAYGYSSHNAAAATKNILSYYFKEASLEDILSGNAESAEGSSNNSFTD